jgi:hypothetical protein
MKQKEKIIEIPEKVIDVPSYIVGMNIMFYIYFAAVHYNQRFTTQALVLNSVIFVFLLFWLTIKRYKKLKQ